MIGFAEAPLLIIQPPNSFCGMLFEERERELRFDGLYPVNLQANTG
jgi:hypothetical protein